MQLCCVVGARLPPDLTGADKMSKVTVTVTVNAYVHRRVPSALMMTHARRCIRTPGPCSPRYICPGPRSPRYLGLLARPHGLHLDVVLQETCRHIRAVKKGLNIGFSGQQCTCTVPTIRQSIYLAAYGPCSIAFGQVRDVVWQPPQVGSGHIR